LGKVLRSTPHYLDYGRSESCAGSVLNRSKSKPEKSVIDKNDSVEGNPHTAQNGIRISPAATRLRRPTLQRLFHRRD